MSRAGFVLLSHRCPQQVQRLTERLARSFDGAHCACHHDFGQSALDTSRFGSRVHFVEPHVTTRWGDFSIVSATLAALRLLYEKDDPDYAILLSGADYPVRNGTELLRDLDAAGADAFCELHLVSPFAADVASLTNWPHARRETLRRYYRAYLPVPFPKLFGQRYIKTLNRWITTWLAPYSRSFRCWAGPQWMTLGRRAAHAVLEWSEQNPWLERYLRARPTSVADESYLHSILGNTPHLLSDSRTFRFYDWEPGSWHPRELTLEDLPNILRSDAHFARKLSPGSELLDAIDEWLDKSLVTTSGSTDTGGRCTS